MHSARVIYFGYGPLAVTALHTLAQVGADVIAVVVPSNRTGADVDVVTECATQKQLPVLVQPPRRASADFVGRIQQMNPDLLLVWSYSMLITPQMMDVAPVINLHGGLLPEYRGGHVMNWAIANGETETGVAMHYIDEGIDTGDVIAQERVPIDVEDDACTVRDKLAQAGQRLILQWWPAIADGTAPREKQDESRAKYWRLRTENDGCIDWTQPAQSIYNLVRALVAPWPGAWTMVNGRKLVIRRCSVEPPTNVAAGTVVEVTSAGVRVASGSGAVVLHEFEMDGHSVPKLKWAQAGLVPGAVLG